MRRIYRWDLSKFIWVDIGFLYRPKNFTYKQYVKLYYSQMTNNSTTDDFNTR